MSVFTDLYSKLNVSAVNNLVDDISPYVRARNTDFPAITYEIPEQTFERISTGTFRSVANAEVRVMARSVTESETIADAVVTALSGTDCYVLDSISRDYEEGYDDESVGLFMVTINLTMYGA